MGGPGHLYFHFRPPVDRKPANNVEMLKTHSLGFGWEVRQLFLD